MLDERRRRHPLVSPGGPGSASAWPVSRLADVERQRGTVASPRARRPWMRARPTASAQGAGRSTNTKPSRAGRPRDLPRSATAAPLTSVAVSVTRSAACPRPANSGTTARLTRLVDDEMRSRRRAGGAVDDDAPDVGGDELDDGGRHRSRR